MANYNFCPLKGNVSLPTHSSGYNLPVDLGYNGNDFSAEEWLCVRPFRSSWDECAWGSFEGHPQFKPVTYQVSHSEILSFLNRSSLQDLVQSQLEDYDNEVGNEFLTVGILLFGYEGKLEWEEVAKTHYDLTPNELNELSILRKEWVNHPTLGGGVNHVTNGGWGHLTHSWSVSFWVGGDPLYSWKTQGFVAHNMSPEAYLDYLK